MTQSIAPVSHPTTSSSSHHHHHRRTQSSNAHKLRPARPTLHRRGTTNYSIHKLGSGQPKQPSEDIDDDCHSDMAASFLNFCAMCEKQITVPDNSLLYCSESCRRKDSCKPLSASCPSTTTMSSSTTPPNSPPMSPRMIVAPLTPTRVSSKSSAPIRIPDEHHDATTDLDPTEWKPVIPLGASGPGRFSTLASSEAWNFLSQFHDEPMLPTRRSSAGNRGSTTSLSAFSAPGTLPALAHTPSTMASSFSSNVSDASVSLLEAAHQRPLPPRHKGTSKSVELVVPHVGAPVVDVTAPESDHGSIVPASSSLWDSSEKTPTRVD